uniref:Unclassified n=1 Tax=Fusarium pseudograminearum CS5834 TaxID=1318459 RepID=W1I9C4_FUSPS|nr:unclassified [Fusarium pseudograminearum CS5834]CDX48203.1 unclassified [Fusarium pseudograminearum CS5834]
MVALKELCRNRLTTSPFNIPPSEGLISKK